MTTKPSTNKEADGKAIRSAHEGHCFVVMPFGRDAEQHRWFQGWYEAVIRPAIEAAGFEPILSATEDQPAAINDEIRSHLVFDPMVVVDLGGRTPEEPPNPNVMYELGVRHAFGLPSVIIAWEGQRLPFDVSNQRAILSRRDFLDIEPTRQRIAKFIQAAKEGRYYNPMESVGREAVIDTASLNLGEDSLLGALALEVRELRTAMQHRPMKDARLWPKRQNIKRLLSKGKKAELWQAAQRLGFDSKVWSNFLNSPIPPNMLEEMVGWGTEDWEQFLAIRGNEIRTAKDFVPEAELVDRVRKSLPPQPWPTGIHKKLAQDLGLPPAQVSDAIKSLIKMGEVHPQVGGQVVLPALK